MRVMLFVVATKVIVQGLEKKLASQADTGPRVLIRRLHGE